MKILAAVDLSQASAYVYEAVHRVAMATDAEVIVMHVITPLPTVAGPEFTPVTETLTLAEKYLDEQDQLSDLVKQFVEADVNATGVLRQGDPVKTVLTEAQSTDAELIVVGCHGHGLLFDALVGSVSTGILRQSPIPVLVVPVRDFD